MSLVINSIKRTDCVSQKIIIIVSNILKKYLDKLLVSIQLLIIQSHLSGMLEDINLMDMTWKQMKN